jgi:glycogen operon protein
VGHFIGDSWKEWNGRFRDDMRSFWRGDPGAVGQVADRLIGSPQIYGHEAREAEQSVNFVTCHDGFTLNDLVSYNAKHNEANGEQNRDGMSDNRSWNCGIEGPSEDPAIESLRNRQVKNFLASTIFALGIPMIGMGDEVRRSQRGNNNAYCQDNDVSWLDWSLLETHRDVHRFATLLNARRLLRSVEPERQRVTLAEMIQRAVKTWHGVRLGQPDWSHDSRSLAFEAVFGQEEFHGYLILNAYWDSLDFALPAVIGAKGPWRRWIDTALDSPQDIVSWAAAEPIAGGSYHAGPRSVVLLYEEL